MKDFKEAIQAAIESSKVQVRKPFNFSFGTKEECKELFRQAFIYSDQTITEFKMLPEYEKVIEWMTNSRGRGLALLGSPGLGKTIILTGVLPIIFNVVYEKILTTIVANDLINDPDYLDRRWAYAIDDIGVERLASDFGSRYEIVDLAVNKAEEKIKPLFLTSNLKMEGLHERYGVRFTDRLLRLCRVIDFSEDSMSLRRK